MGAPRQILHGSAYLITRRCSERRFFLRPDPFVALLTGYLLAQVTKRFGIRICCCVVMANHYHAVVVDVNGRLPKFLHWFHRLLAVGMNVFRGRREAFWSSEKPNVVRLETSADVLDKMVYVLSNPLTADLAGTIDSYPGFITLPRMFLDEEGTEYRRPDTYFNPEGRMPPAARLCLSKPPGFDDMDMNTFVAMLEERIRRNEEEHARRLETEGRTLPAPAALRAVDWRSAPTTPAPRPTRNPNIAAKDPAVRVAALERQRAFRAEHAEAMAAWRRGRRDVVFPAGTWWMCVYHSARCHPASEDTPSERPCATVAEHTSAAA